MNTRRIAAAVLLLGCCGLNCRPLQAQSNWVRKANMPTARAGLAACAVDGKIYAIGGAPRNQVVTAIVEQYDPATDSWTTKASMNTPRAFFGASVVNGKIYVVGGWAQGGSYLASCEEYDPVANVWTTKASRATNGFFVSVVTVGAKLYVLGGGTRVGPNLPTSPTAALLGVEEYDPATDNWSPKAALPKSHAGPGAACVVDGMIYYAGGGNTQYMGTGSDLAVSLVHVYDPGTDTWRTNAPMLTTRACFGTCAVNEALYAFGGCVTTAYDSSETSSMEAYDPVAGRWWKMAPMLFKRKAMGAAEANGKIYAIGGVAQGGWEPALSVVEEYDPKPTVSASRSGSTLRISWNGILEASDNVDGTNWQALNPVTWPYSVSLQAAPMKFYRARQP